MTVVKNPMPRYQHNKKSPDQETERGFFFVAGFEGLSS